MKTSRTHAALHRISAAASLLSGLITATPSFATSPACTSEHFTSGAHTLPSYDEAMAECMAQETAMTNQQSGAFRRLRSCHEIGSKGNHGPWLHGRIGVDVIERSSGDRYTFEGLWMCKPVAEADFDGSYMTRASYAPLAWRARYRPGESPKARRNIATNALGVA